MDILEIIRNRYSVRDYEERQIEKEKLDKILEAGRLAPTAKNQQPQRIFVLQSEEAIKKAREITPSAYNAPTILLVCGDVEVAYTRAKDSWNAATLDSTIVACHMLLEAESIGIGSCWVCAFDASKVTTAYKLPENVVPYSMILLGYPSKDCQPNPRHFERLSIDETVKYL